MRLSIDKYDYKEVRLIYLKKLKEDKWTIFDNDEVNQIPVHFFEKNKDIFKFNGRDMENLWSLTKMVHARRMFGKDHKLLKKITKEDLKNAFDKYKENEEVDSRNNNEIRKYLENTMYC